MTVAALKKLLHDLDDNLIVCTDTEDGAVEVKSIELWKERAYYPIDGNGYGDITKIEKPVIIIG